MPPITPLHLVPFSSIAWGVGAFSILLFSLKSFRRYRLTQNELTGLFARFALVVSCALGLYSIPTFFTLDLKLIRDFYLLGDLLLYAGWLVQLRLLWYIGFKSPSLYRFFQAVILFCGAYIWVNSYLYSTLTLQGNIIQQLLNAPTSVTLRGLLLAALLLPTGYFFIQRGLQESDASARFKSIGIGMAYFLVGLSSSYTDIFSGGLTSPQFSAINLIVFIIFLISVLWPSRKLPLVRK